MLSSVEPWLADLAPDEILREHGRLHGESNTRKVTRWRRKQLAATARIARSRTTSARSV